MQTDKIEYHWSTQNYIDLVENTKNTFLSDFQKTELDYIKTNIKVTSEKTLIDVGAGYGRTLSELAELFQNSLAVEIEKDFFEELQKRCQHLPNCEMISGDANKLSKLLQGKSIINPVLVCLQNSLGTWHGDFHEALEEMKRIAEKNQGEIVLSLFCQEALGTKGIDMYKALSRLVGKLDLERTDFEKGVFRSKTNYLSHWWTKEERNELTNLLAGRVVNKLDNDKFFILHTSF